MKRSFLVLILIVVVMVAAGISLARRSHALAPAEDTAPEPSVSSNLTPARQAGTAEPAANGPASAAQINNQKVLADLLHEFIKPERSMDELLKVLRESRQQPYLMRDKNEFTGEMDIIRTKSPLPGTRYFHAQYFADEENRHFLQHMSFEFPGPSPESWSQAFNTVQSSFPGLGSPVTKRDDFVEWDAGDGYSLWMKRLSASDLKDNPFNAYTSADVGTIQVAIELNPEVE